MQCKTTRDWRQEFAKVGALFIHDGNPERPHALLTQGGHSDGFFNATMVIRDPRLLESAGNVLYEATVSELNTERDVADTPHWVIGSAMGAVTLAYQMAASQGCFAGFTEPAEDERGKQMILKRFNVKPGSRVLVVEDVITTGGTTLKTIEALEEAGAEVMPAVAVLCNRSGMKELGGRKIITLINRAMPTWEPENCPLCRLGSEAIRPKGNWDRLTKQY